jgi:hypothetical protein
MSYLMSSACVRLKCPGVAKSVLMQLADIANDHGHAWPSIETICMRTDWSRRAVIDALAWLEANGAIMRNRDNGRHTSYRITPAKFTGPRHEDPVDKSPDQCATRTGAPNAPVRQLHLTSAPAALDQCAKRTLTTKNHQEPLIPPYPPVGGASQSENQETENPHAPKDTELFERFMRAYPKKVDQSGALRSWRRLAPTPELLAQMLAAIGLWMETTQWREHDGRFIPKPGNWLRNQLWLDVPGAGVDTPPPPPPLPPPVTLTPEQLAENKRRAVEARALAQRALVRKVA